MAKIVVQTDMAPKPPASYSQAIKSNGMVLFRQGPFQAATGKVVGDTIQEATAQCFKNIAAILKRPAAHSTKR